MRIQTLFVVVVGVDDVVKLKFNSDFITANSNVFEMGQFYWARFSKKTEKIKTSLLNIFFSSSYNKLMCLSERTKRNCFFFRSFIFSVNFRVNFFIMFMLRVQANQCKIDSFAISLNTKKRSHVSKIR